MSIVCHSGTDLDIGSEPPKTLGLGSPLGNTAKSSVRSPENHAKASRAIRYQAHSQARFILRSEALKTNPDKFPGNVFRTVDCRYVNHSDIAVNFSKEFQAAHYGGLKTCGSVWACPICAARIQERRRLEIDQAIAWAEKSGWFAIMITFTFPHTQFQSLTDLLDRQAHAYRLLRQTRPWRALMKRIDFQGLIRSLEVTHGQNGWHPHTHELWFVKSAPEAAEIASLWKTACISAGLLDPTDHQRCAAFDVHSVDAKTDIDSGDYLAKQDDSRTWGISHEIAKATTKSGRAKGVHPHHFLIRQSANDDINYLEYVQGMKGKRQLFWSNGLKAKAGIGETTDEEIATDHREDAEILSLLTRDQWNLIRGNDARAELLEAAETGGLPAVESFLKSLA